MVGNTYPFKLGSCLSCCGSPEGRTWCPLFMRDCQEKYHQGGRQCDSWARSGLGNARDGGKRPGPGGREVGNWQLLVFAGEERGEVKAKIHIQHVLTNSHFTTSVASWHCWLQLQNTGFNVSVSLSSILCWTIYSWENKCCNSRFIVSFRQVLVMHVKSKAFFLIIIIRLQLALVFC